MTTDEQLMLAVKNGSRDAFQTLFERYRDLIWRFFRRRTPDAARAEELTQEAFLAVLQGIPRYEPRGLFRSYLFGVAYHLLSADRRKLSHRAETLEAEPLAHSPDPDVAMWVRRALSHLDDTDREILMLREYEQLSYQEIADLLRVPLNTVRSRLFRARMALKAALIPDAGITMRVRHDG